MDKGIDIPIEEGDLRLFPDFLSERQSSALFDELLRDTDWSQPRLRMGKRDIPIPRLQAWYGSPEAGYSYSGLMLKPLPWTKALLSIKAKVEEATNSVFNAVLINLYRDGQDSVGWHSDDEPELGLNPVVASLSLGAVRRFRLQNKRHQAWRRSFDLPSGSLLVMAGALQHHWRHQLPKTQRAVAPRINLTFRYVVRSGSKSALKSA